LIQSEASTRNSALGRTLATARRLLDSLRASPEIELGDSNQRLVRLGPIVREQAGMAINQRGSGR
jgi:hypothetical protein